MLPRFSVALSLCHQKCSSCGLQRVLVRASSSTATAPTTAVASISGARPDSLELQRQRRKRLDVAIVGLPNAGKSQLLNVLTATPISAVSRKRHTTVKGILGARTVTVDDEETGEKIATQLLFVDTPGFLRKQDEVDRDHIESPATQEMRYVDHTLLVVDAARHLTESVKETLVQLILLAMQSKGRQPDEDDEMDEDGDDDDDDDDEMQFDYNLGKKLSVVLNKVDLIYPKSDLIDIAMEIGEIGEQCILYQLKRQQQQGMDLTEKDMPTNHPSLSPEVMSELMPMFFYVSALKKNDPGVDDLLQFLLEKATPCSSWELEPGECTTLTPEERVEEVVREKLYHCLHQELPYQVRQTNRLFHVVPAREQGGVPTVVAHQDILVRTTSHRDMVRGSGNRTLERIKELATRDLQKAFRCNVELYLHVKLIKSKQGNWTLP